MKAQAATAVTDLLEASDRVALVHGDERITHGELHEQVERLAGALAAYAAPGGEIRVHEGESRLTAGAES